MTKKELSREQIIEIASQLINELGPDGFSMRALANALNCGTMSTYRHVSSKEELLVLTANWILDHVEFPPHDMPWDDRFHRCFEVVWEQIKPHRWLPTFLLNMPTPTPSLGRVFEEGRDALIEGGLSQEEAEKTMVIAWGMTAGLASWSEDPTPFMRHGVDLIVAGVRAQSGTVRRRPARA